MALKGKKPTSAQRKILIRSGKVLHPEDYLYIGTHYIDPDGYKSPSKNNTVQQVMVFRNRYNGDEVAIEV